MGLLEKKGKLKMNKRGTNKKTILYYPTIKIKDGSWLRNAILYWDNVASIVPGYNYDEINSPEIEYLQQVGIYKPIYPIDLGHNEVLCDQFCCEVKDKLRQCRRSNKNEKITQIHREKIAIDQNAMLHINKTPDLILDFLKDQGIVMENCDGPWLNMKSSDAEVYMSILAKYLAKLTGNTDIGTDFSPKFFKPHVRTYKHVEEKQLYLDMALQEILPEPNMKGVPIQDVIDFRLEYGEELQRFRKRIEAFHDSLKWQVEDVDDLHEKTMRFKQEIEMDLQMIEALLNHENIPFKRCSLRSLLPIGLTAGIGILAWKGYMSEIQAIGTESVLNIMMALFASKKVSSESLSDANAYLFYAKKYGMIK